MAGLKLGLWARYSTSCSLNPFEFRAGLKRYADVGIGWHGGLNPFEFRAGLKHIEDAIYHTAHGS